MTVLLARALFHLVSLWFSNLPWVSQLGGSWAWDLRVDLCSLGLCQTTLMLAFLPPLQSDLLQEVFNPVVQLKGVIASGPSYPAAHMK